MADSVQVLAEEILKILNRHINCLADDNRNTRKRALEGIRKETLDKKPALEANVLKILTTEIIKPLLKLLSDPVEKCRELSITYLFDCLKRVPEPYDYLPYIMPVLVQRLGQQDVIEQSEELRLQLIEFLQTIVSFSGKKLSVYLDDMIKILQRTLVDPYPEVKKESCKCASALAKSIPEHFHMQSESLIKPLLQSISHQHSRVRVEVIKTIGVVIQNGNNKSVEDVVSHLAQRLFDQAPAVRIAVTEVVGFWLLDLMDRYSFHRQLLPLLLTSITDELPEIREKAEALWHDVGLKYEGENEDDLKEKQDFAEEEPVHYPPGVERSNLGCRQLVYRNFSKILPGLLRDMGDWVLETRVKSAALLHTLILNSEDNVTQHMEKLLSGLYRACNDEDARVVKDVVRCGELIGYFVKPEVWCKLVLQSVRTTQSHGSLMVLAAIVRGSQRAQIHEHLQKICKTLSSDEVCRSAEGQVQQQLVACVDAIVCVCHEDCRDISLYLFTILVSVLALQKQEEVGQTADETLAKLAQCQGYQNVQGLYNVHTKQVIDNLKDSAVVWNNYSEERLIFDTLLLKCGPVVGELLEDIIPMMVTNLNPEKDPEVRLKLFSLLSRLMMNSSHTLDSRQRFSEFGVIVVRDMILPNCLWRAGRAAGAIRTTAVSCLWALLQSGVLTKEKLLEVENDLLTQCISSLEDDNKSTRLVTCRVLARVFTVLGTNINQDRLHNMYPDLLKRLDDSSDDIRVAVAKTFITYFDCFMDGYDVALYKAHLEALYKGLIVHLDDPDRNIQEAILDVLKKAASLQPSMLQHEIEDVKHKHRSPKYCESLIEYINKLSAS